MKSGNKKLVGLLMTLLLQFSIVNLSAQNTEDLLELSLDDLLNVKVNISSTQGEDIFSATSTVSVIDAEMIKKYHFNSISEALQTVSGFSVSRTYLKRNLPTSRGILQDHYANKVLVLINNVPTWNAVTGEPALDRINIHDVERIEVLKGPASVLYGTNAYSGAVNIILKQKDTKSAHLGLGQYASYDAGGYYNYSFAKGQTFISANTINSTGKNFTFTDETNATGHYNEFENSSNFTIKTNYGSHDLFFNGFVYEESFLGVTPRFNQGAGRSQTSKGYLINYAYNTNLTDKISIKSGIIADWNQRDFPRTIDDSVRANVEGTRILGFAKSRFTLSQSLSLDFGADYEHRESHEYSNYSPWESQIQAHNNMADRTVQEFSVFSQLGYKYKSFNTLLGARYINNELFGSNVSTRGTVVYTLNDKNSLKFIFGQSFRAPSIFELYFETSSKTVFGNTELEPEKSNSFELAYLTSFNKLYLQALAYYATYDNKIFRTQQDVVRNEVVYPNTSVYANGNQFNAKGIEIELKYVNPGFLNGFANYSFIKGNAGDEIGDSDNYNFKYVPQHKMTFGLNKTVKGFRLAGLLNMVSDTEGPLAEVSASTTLDMNLGYSHKLSNNNIYHTLFVKNVFDEDQQVPEYVRRRTLNSITTGYGRVCGYSVQFEF